jgi:acetolactate synthase I/II/III large subunit
VTKSTSVLSVPSVSPLHDPDPVALVPAAREILAQLVADGISLVFALPGGPLMPIYQELYLQHALRTILVRHEAGAIFAADGYARASGQMAACAITAGPGTTNAVSALAVALRDMVPLFVIAALPPQAVDGRGAAQELDTPAILERVSKKTTVLRVPERAGELTRDLLRVARSGRPGPVVLCIPADVAGRMVANAGPLPPQRYRTDARPHDASGAVQAARILCRAHRPALLVGSGATQAGAAGAVRRLAERLRCAVASTPRAKGIFPETHPLSVGPFGFAGSPLADRVIGEEADVLLVVGSRLGELSSASWTTRLARKKIIQLDLIPEEIARNYPIELALVGDARRSLEAIDAQLAADGWTHAEMPFGTPRWLQEPAPDARAFPLDPRWVFRVLRQELDAQTHLYCDIGNSMCWAIRHFVAERPAQFHVNLTYGCMGHAIPAAVGGALAIGADRIVSVVGDSAFAMTGGEIAVAVEAGLAGPLWVVLDNGGNGMCHVGFKMACDGRAPSSQFSQRIDAAAIARAHGAAAFVVERPEDLAKTLRAARAARRPAVVQVPIDPEAVPPLGLRLEALSFVPRSDAGDRR